MRRGLTNNQIKLIAMVAMLADHMGLLLFPACIILRVIGRLSFPLFAYMIAEGCTHTRHKGRHFLGMAGMGLACQVVYLVVDGSWHLNVLLTFTLSMVLIFSVEAFVQHKTARTAVGMIGGVGLVAFATTVAPWLFASVGFHIDYTLTGVLFPVVIYFMPNRRCKLVGAVLMAVLLGIQYGGLQWYGLLAWPILLAYNGERGKHRLKYLFYIFYPAHLVLLYGIAAWVR